MNTCVGQSITINWHCMNTFVGQSISRPNHIQVKKSEGLEKVQIISIVERDVSNVFYSERKVRLFYSQSDKIYPK